MARQQNILAFVVGIALGLGHAAVPAQSSVGFAEYYVMGDEADIITAYKTDTGIPGSGVPTTATAANIDSRLSIVSSAAGVNVYVDEWENGYGFSQSNPVGTADARWDNGPAGPNKQGGALAQGQVLTFSETTTFAPGSEGIDGGDRIFITGAPVTMVRNIWPDDPGPYIAGSWELFPTVAWQSDYQVPVGEDLNVSTVMNPGANNGGDLWIPFEYTFVFFTVEEDNTRVVVTEPGGTVRYNQVLGQGDSGAVLRIPSGTTVTGRDATTGDPVRLQAGIITSVNENIDTRYYTLTPDAFIGNDYYLPVPSMRTYFYEPSGGNLPVVAGAFVYTLQADTDIRIETATTSMVVNVPNQGQVYRFVMPEMPAGVFGGPYGARISTVDPSHKIWVVVAGDEEEDLVDWGYQALDVNLLERNYFLPFAPANPAYVTPTVDGTTFFVDNNNDNVPDDSFVLNRFDIRQIFPPASTLDNTGTHIYADNDFVMAWGQDQSQDTPGERASNPLGTDMDFGYTVLPLRWFEPRLTIQHDITPSLMPVGGGSATFSIVVTGDIDPIHNLTIGDLIPPGWTFTSNTATIVFSDGATPTLTGAGANPAISGPNSRTLNWNLATLLSIPGYTLPPGQTVTITFTGATTPGQFSFGQNISLASALGTSTVLANDPAAFLFNPEDDASTYIPALSLTKTSSVTPIPQAPGETITYTVTATNISPAPLSNVILSDVLPDGTAYVPGTRSIVAPPATSGTYRDDFDTTVYSLNKGTYHWTNIWTESGDSGTQGSPISGEVQVAADGGDNRLRIESPNRQIVRQCNLFGATTATLNYQFRRNALDDANDWVESRVSGDGGATWTVLQRHAGSATDGAFQNSTTHNIAAFAAVNTQIGFFSSANLGGNDTVYIDNVVIDFAGGSGRGVAAQESFNAVAYNNASTGDHPWNGNWTEGGDDGTAQSPTAGNIQIQTDASANRLRISNVNRSITRPVNLQFAQSGSLSYVFRRQSLDNANDWVESRVSGDNGGSWRVLARHEGSATDAGYTAVSFPLQAGELTSQALIGFFSSASLGGNDIVYFDEIKVGADFGSDFPVLARGHTLQAGQSITATFDVVIADPLDETIKNVPNNAYVTSAQSPTPLVASTLDWIVNFMSGTVFNDRNGNGLYDPTSGELPYQGASVEIWEDLNMNGIVEPGTDLLETTLVTNASGFYEHFVRRSGDFLERVLVNTLPADSFLTREPPHDSIFPLFGDRDRQNDFGYRPGLCLVFPSGSPTDGRFVSVAGNGLSTMTNERLSFFIAVEDGVPSFRIDIFDGDTGKDDAGTYNWGIGNWDYRGAADKELSFSLWADPNKSFATSTLIAEWLGNTPNPTTDPSMTPLWTTSGPVMPNNQWWSALINTSAAAQSGSGNYFYRLDVEFSDFNPNTDAWSNFKLRTTGHSISAAPGVMTFAAPMQTISDFNIVFPGNMGLNNPDPMGTTTYNGTWPFLFEFANPFGQFEIWNGDLDAGNASGTVVDTDDANTAAAQRPPVALSGSELDEGARGMGLPADNSPIVWRRVGGDISMRLTAPGGTQFEDLNPSGNSEWERWVVGSVLGPLNADVVAPLAALPAGIYTLEVRGLDLTNLTYLYFPQEVFSCQLGNPLGRVSLASRESSISGRLGEDLDRDGTLQAGEPGVANRVVTLEGVESFSGKSVSLRARTDADGRYSFHPLEAGEYDVHLQAVRDGLSLKTPAKRRVELGLDDVRDGENFLFAARPATAAPNLDVVEQGVGGAVEQPRPRE